MCITIYKLENYNHKHILKTMSNTTVFPFNINQGNCLHYLNKNAFLLKSQTGQLSKKTMASLSSRKPKPETFLYAPQTQHTKIP